MIKLFVTGDNHLCRQYAASPIKDILIQSRIESLRQMIRNADAEECNYFVITGDLFDRVSNITKKEIDQIVGILEEFSQTVLVLPGNHDFYTGSEKLWKDFIDLKKEDSNIVLLNERKVYRFGSDEKEVLFYPAYCDSKHSKTNRVDWITERIEQTESFNIGIAHGTIRGISPDMNEEYFPMDITELNTIPVDAWLIGHTHITYPFDLPYNKDVIGYNIFNAGTHEQLDSSNNTEGNAFIITLNRESGIKKVLVRKIQTGNITYKKISYHIEAGELQSLERILIQMVSGISTRTVVDLEISGSIDDEDYQNRNDLYQTVLGQFLYYSVNDELLVPAITIDKIQDEFSEFSLAAQFLETLLDDPVEVQMAYELLKKYSGTEK